jgi:hypothetical protein
MSKPDPASLPPAPHEETAGLSYFPRLTGKIRLHAAGALWEELHANLGKGIDQWLTGFLHVDYAALREQVLAGGTDAEIFAWCEASGRPLNDMDRLVWNAFTAKLGWNDFATPSLERRKAEGGLSDRSDIQTITHYIEVDEGRRE